MTCPLEDSIKAHWPMFVSRCMVECQSFYAFLLILYSQGSVASSHDSWFKCQQTKKQYNIRITHFTEIVYLKQRKEDMLSLVFKKLNISPFMPASRGVNPLTTSHTVEHLWSICLHSWSHDKPNLYFIYYCFNKIEIAWYLW